VGGAGGQNPAVRSAGERIPYVPALDGVRGVAVFAVLLFHDDLLRGGYLGVDLFFLLSGYLITALLIAEVTGTGRIDLIAFWGRRARRLLPALFLVLAAVALYCVVFAEPTELGQIRGDALATIGYVANWRFIVNGFDYWSLFRAPSPLEHTWSLAIEEQFYILWPLVVMALLRIGRRGRLDAASVARRVFLGAGVLSAVFIAWAAGVWLTTYDTNRLYYGTDTRAPAILIGATLAGWTAWRGTVRSDGGRVALEVVGLGAAGFLALAWTQLDGYWLFRGGLVVCAFAGVAVVAAAAHPRRGPIARALGVRPLVALGIVSYGVYLWHWPVFVVIDTARTGLTDWALLAIRFPVTLALAVASYRWVEEPIRRGRVGFGRLRVATPVVVTALVVVLVAVTAGAVEFGFGPDGPDRAHIRRQAVRARRSDATRVLVVGNSVAYSLARDGFARVPTARPTEVVNDGISSCDFPPSRLVRDVHVSEPSRPFDCTASWRMAVRTFDPEVAILALGDVHQQRYLLGGRWLSECDPAFASHFVAALDAGVAQLAARGAHVVLTTAAYSTLLGGEAANAPVRADTKCVNTLIRLYASSHPRIQLVDLQRYVCPMRDRCLDTMRGAPLRPDGVHYRGPGAQIVARWVFAQVGIDRWHGAGGGDGATT